MSSNTDFQVRDKGQEGAQRPQSELDIYQQAIDKAATGDLDDVNLGLGYYQNREMWQQVESYQKGLFANAAFARAIVGRATEQAKRKLALRGKTVYDEEELDVTAKTGWEDLTDSQKEQKDRRRYLERRKEEIWTDLSKEERKEVIESLGGVSDWTPPQWQMLTVRHEASRSRGARLMDNVFGRVQEFLSDDDADDAIQRLGRRGER